MAVAARHASKIDQRVQPDPQHHRQGKGNLQQAEINPLAVLAVDVLSKEEKRHGRKQHREQRSSRAPHADAEGDLPPDFLDQGQGSDATGGLDGEGDGQLLAHGQLNTLFLLNVLAT